MSSARIEDRDGQSHCLDCGAQVVDTHAHYRFHDILSDHAAALAVLKVAHIGATIHDKYEVSERIDARVIGNNWSAEAFAEVTGTEAQPSGVDNGD